MKTITECDNCGNLCHEDELDVPRHLSERVDVGGPMPSGECCLCGALAYPVRLGDPKAAHLYEIETTAGTLEVDAGNRNQAERIATKAGYKVHSVNMIG